MIRILTISAALLALAGCATPPHACKLKEGGTCGSMQEIYETARKAPRDTSRQFINEAPRNAEKPTPLQHNPSAYSEPGDQGQPVFKQPRVYRVWLAPYVDADGNLRSGEYTYFSTPGEWAYGTTREAGAGSSATFAPQLPGQLGFTPVEKPNKAAPAKPGDLPAPASVTTSDGITQPGQTLAR